ncbi:MAG: mechanosensitive ion channel [Bacteroidota bacterium]|nr:mechanosensitive ion channel [Bacteroidota bacterium]MDP3145470.1 mechanosensitive ion channel [Bacteroidota bacterium]MDP3556426.1 mechanosensitive ion channel [Bacteroidota bacterium]
MKTISKLLFCFLLMFNVQKHFAQKDTIKKVNDSINNSILANFNKKTAESERLRKEDSTKKAELESQLQSLKTTDNLKKEELQKQLEELNNRDSKRLSEKKARIDSLRITAKSFPVLGFFNDTLFSIYSKLGSFSASDRANAIESRVKKLKDLLNFKIDSIKIIETETTVDLMVGESIIMSVSENDAIWNNTAKLDLSKKYKSIIGESILKYKAETSYITLLKEIGLAILVLAAMVVLLYYLIKLFKWTAQKISDQEGKRIKGLKIKNYTLFDAKSQVNVILSINTILKWLLIILIIYIALPILFGIFPWTKNFADTLFGYILNPAKSIALGVWNYLPNLITIIVIVFIFRYALKGIYFLKSEIEKGNLHINGFYPDWANPTYQIIKVVIYAFMGIVIFPYLPGSDSPVFQGVSVFLGVLFTFGSSGSLSNVIAGLVLTYMRLFKIGDRVKIGEVVGDVIEKSLLVTRIRTIKNEIISIPNSTVMSSHTINYSSDTLDSGLIMHTTVTIGYDVPWKTMHQALLNAADRTDLILKDPKPFVLQTSLDDFYVSYQINLYTKEANKQATIYSQLHSNIQDCCNEMGIEILSPHYRAARDGNTTTIPSDYLSKDYKAPSFNVKIKKED